MALSDATRTFNTFNVQELCQVPTGLRACLRPGLRYIGAMTSRPETLVEVPAGHSYLIAVSGGPDSTMLLHLLAGRAREWRLRLYAAHVNYRLRGKDSDGDELYCHKLCEKLGIKLFVKRIRSGALNKSNFQETARNIRYEFFDELCARHDIDFIATGHNRDDNAETVLMHLGRGSGTFGLGGISAREGNLIRPLLHLSRAQIEAYLKRHKLTPRIDGSNLEPKYLRNKIRLQLMPQMARLFGDAVAGNIHRSAQIISEQEKLLRTFAEELLAADARTTAFGKIVLDLDKFHLYYPMLQRLVVAMCYERLHGSLRGFDFETCERVLTLAGGKVDRVDLKAGILAELSERQIFLYRKTAPMDSIAVRRTGVTSVPIFRAEFEARKLPRTQVSETQLRSGDNLRVYFDAAKLRGKLFVRSFRNGDRLRPLGMKGTRKLSDILIDARIPRPLREEIPLVICGDRIAWVVGQAISEEFKLSEKSKTAIMMEVKPYRGL